MAGKSIGTLVFNFGANLEGFDKAMKKAQKSLDKFSRQMKRTGQNLTRSVTLPILGLGIASIKVASDFEETQAKFSTVFSSIQGDAERTADTFKEAFGLSESAAKSLLADTGDLLVGFGFTEAGALKLSRQVNELAVDLASFTNFSGGAEGASLALTKALLGERESIKQLGIAITEADLKQYAADNGLVWKELDRVAKAQLTFELASKQSFKAIGDFSRTSGSFANQLRVVRGDLMDLGVEIGTILLPLAQDLLAWVKDMINRFSLLDPHVKGQILLWAGLAAAVGPLLMIFGSMATGLSILIGVFAKLSTFIVANPYLALAAAIVTVGFALGELIKSLKKQNVELETLKSIEDEVNRATADEIANIRIKTKLLLDENSSMEDKKKILGDLKSTYPGYYDAIDETSISTEHLTNASNKLISSMKQQARMTAIVARITAIEKRKLQLETSKPEDLGGLMGGAHSFFSFLGIGASDEKWATYAMNQFKKETNELNSEMDVLLGLMSDIKKTDPFVNYEPKKLVHNTNKLSNSQGDLNTELGKQVESFTKLNAKWKEMDYIIPKVKNDIVLATHEFGNFGTVVESELGILDTKFAQIIGDVETFESVFFDLMNGLGNELSKGAESFEEYAKTVKNAIRDVIGALISKMVALAITKALESSAILPFWMIPIVAGAAAGLAKTAFNSLVPAFAEGGLVSGPTMGLVGEGIGTSAANPEVIAPLDKLKDMMGQNRVEVVGRLKGNDIYLSNARTALLRDRTV